MKSTTSLLFLLILISSLRPGTSNWLYNHIYGVSDKAPLAAEINKDGNGKRALRELLEYYASLQANTKNLGSRYEELATKNIVKTTLKHYGWPPLSAETERVYEVQEPVTGGTRTAAEIVKEQERYFKQMDIFEKNESKVFRNIETFTNAYEAAGPKVNLVTKVSWNFHNGLVHYRSDDRIHSCSVRSRAAFRIYGTWTIASTLTNAPRNIFKKERERLYLAEYLYIDGNDQVQAIPFSLKVAFDNNSSQYWQGSAAVPSNSSMRINVTDILSVWGGRPSSYQFGGKLISDNIGVKAALEKSRDMTRQVQDTRTASNAAILVFPIFLALLPLALFADVSDFVTIGYVIFTDFLSVLPLAIKGVELLIVGLRSEIATRTLIMGKLELNGTVIAETWAVKCRADSSLVTFGAVFITIAILAMVFGIALEFFARSKLMRNKQLARLRSVGAGVEHFWKKSAPCSACKCDGTANQWERDESVAAGSGLIGQILHRRPRAKVAH